MKSKTIAKIKKKGRNLGLTGIIVAISVGVLLPVLLASTVGIITLAMGESSQAILVGVLVISFTATAIGSAVIITVLLGKKSRIARLQGDLLANVTHDLHTPLTAIRMYAQTLQMGKLEDNPDRVKESLETIIRETLWLETMIDRFLTWRITVSDRKHLKMQTGSIQKAVEEAVHRFSRLMNQGEVDLSLKLQSQAPVDHDSIGLCMAVLNLLINAYKYTRAEKKISITTQDQDGRVFIIIEDNGIGIPEKEVRRIFDPFYRVDNNLRRQSSGVGLGLAIVRHMVKAHNGEVMVESQEGHGSTFTIALPQST